MRSLLACLLGLAVLALATIACQKITPTQPEMGALAYEQVVMEDAIPLEFGELKAIHALPELEYTAVLWFEKADKTIVEVKFNWSHGHSGSKRT